MLTDCWKNDNMQLISLGDLCLLSPAHATMKLVA